MGDDVLFVVARLVALICFLVLVVPVVARIRESETRAVLYARIATAMLLIHVAYVQVYSAAVRLFDATPDWGPPVVAFYAALTGLVCVWGFWPWRRP